MVLMVNLAGLIFIGLILWWFLFSKPKATKISGNTIDIKVQNGVYHPSNIKGRLGQQLYLRFTRLDESPCAEYVIFDQLDINAKLPIREPYTITLMPDKVGEFEFTCQMGMYRGRLVIE